jgi:hypothetical protein
MYRPAPPGGNMVGVGIVPLLLAFHWWLLDSRRVVQKLNTVTSATRVARNQRMTVSPVVRCIVCRGSAQDRHLRRTGWRGGRAAADHGDSRNTLSTSGSSDKLQCCAVTCGRAEWFSITVPLLSRASIVYVNKSSAAWSLAGPFQ